MKAKNKLITKLLIKICVFCKVLVVSLQKKKKKKKKIVLIATINIFQS